jgi:hypothetical protein
MDSAIPASVAARLPAARRPDLNWGLIVAVGLCIVFWAAATFGLFLIL